MPSTYLLPKSDGRNWEPREMRAPWSLTRRASLRTRVALLSATVVLVAVAAMGAAAYFSLYRSMFNDIDSQLESRADGMALLAESGRLAADPEALLAGAAFSTNIALAWVLPTGQVYLLGDVDLLHVDADVARATNVGGERTSSFRTVDHTRVLTVKLNDDSVIMLSQSLSHVDRVLARMASGLLVVGSIAVGAALVLSFVAAAAGLRPVARLTRATERVARTQEFTPIPVSGNDELASLTRSFNTMLKALADSRDQQARLVADAGHELRTPLTSLRTNIELLNAASAPGAPEISASDMVELRADILAQIEELSTLVGDLVDLSREDAREVVLQEIDLVEVIDEVLERVRRRRSDIEFDVVTEPWFVFGDEHGMSRAVLNVLDNAAKWSPGGHAVIVRLTQVTPTQAELTVADAGPGIPPEDRHLVFERFYRAPQARSMPGSGLGLAIVRQAIDRLGGSIVAEQSPQGGALIRMTVPGSPVHTEPSPQVVRR